MNFGAEFYANTWRITMDYWNIWPLNIIIQLYTSCIIIGVIPRLMRWSHQWLSVN